MVSFAGFDTETYRIGAPDENNYGVDITPKLVCVSVAWRELDGVHHALLTPWEDDIVGFFRGLVANPDVHLVGHNTAYDERVLCKTYPELFTVFWELHIQGRIHCTQTGEKLSNVARAGQVYTTLLPDGSMGRINYGLNDLSMRHRGVDRAEEKHGEAAWRLNYCYLDNVAKQDWPDDAVKYAVDDAIETLLVAEAQRLGPITGPVTEELRTTMAFACGIMTQNGIATHAANFHALNAEVEAGMRAENFPDLVQRGILILSQPPMPYANGQREHQPDCENGGKGQECSCPPKMKKETKEKTSRTKLQEYILAFCRLNNVPIELTDKGQEEYKFYTDQKAKELPGADDWWEYNPKTVSASAGFVSKLAKMEQDCFTKYQLKELHDQGRHCGPMSEYAARQKLAKLQSTYLPQLTYRNEDDPRLGQLAQRVHFEFDVVKETGRTSSFASRLYPSANGQNMDPRIRPCYRAEDGNVILSWDYSSLELVSLADTCLRLFGFSRMAELLKEGVDLHAYLGAQLAYAMDPDFRKAADDHVGGALDRRTFYEIFLTYKEYNEDYFEHWRTFAKPVGLGYPGGLGAETLVDFAWAAYKIATDVETAKLMKEIWLETYPEMALYFEYVNKECKDKANTTRDPETGKIKAKYTYTTPLGMVRAGAHYTAACNGLGMQSPSAEGALLGVILVVRACTDPSMGSILYGCKPFDFVHDEILVEMPYDEDPALATARCEEVGRLMVHGMSQVISSVPVKGEPAISRIWHKKAKEIRNAQGLLVPWEPPKKAAAA